MTLTFRRDLDLGAPRNTTDQSRCFLSFPSKANLTINIHLYPPPVYAFRLLIAKESKSERSLSSASISAIIGDKYGISSSGFVC